MKILIAGYREAGESLVETVDGFWVAPFLALGVATFVVSTLAVVLGLFLNKFLS